MQRDEMLPFFLRWRGVNPENACAGCGGSGRKGYMHGSTWRGGVGHTGRAYDVCDDCWGTGDKTNKGVDLRKMRDEERQRIAQGALTLLARRAGASLQDCRAGVTELAAELERMANGRKQRARWFYQVCHEVARTLREGLNGKTNNDDEGT